MSKKIDVDIDCSQCKKVFTANLYRSIWIEFPENLELIMKDKINTVTCPHCQFSERVHIPFLCTNVRRRFAIWYEPYDDPNIDEDQAMYSASFGKDSFYAIAPRIKEWQEFKRRIIDFDLENNEGNGDARPSDKKDTPPEFMSFLESLYEEHHNLNQDNSPEKEKKAVPQKVKLVTKHSNTFFELRSEGRRRMRLLASIVASTLTFLIVFSNDIEDSEVFIGAIILALLMFFMFFTLVSAVFWVKDGYEHEKDDQ